MGNISAGHELISRTAKKSVYGKLSKKEYFITDCYSDFLGPFSYFIIYIFTPLLAIGLSCYAMCIILVLFYFYQVHC